MRSRGAGGQVASTGGCDRRLVLTCFILARQQNRICRSPHPSTDGNNCLDARRTKSTSGGVLLLSCCHFIDLFPPYQNKCRAFQILRARLLDLKLTKQMAEQRAIRNNLVHSADRSEKIRTYNYPQVSFNLSLYTLNCNNKPVGPCDGPPDRTDAKKSDGRHGRRRAGGHTRRAGTARQGGSH